MVPAAPASGRSIDPNAAHAAHVLIGLLTLLTGFMFVRSLGTTDTAIFLNWMATIRARGVIEGYAATATPQPPLYAVFFWVAAWFADRLGVTLFLAYKFSLLVAWILTALCLRLWTRNTAAISVVQLALIPNSLGLAYFDIYLAPLLLTALWSAWKKRWLFFSVSFTLFAFTKTQALILVPFAVVFSATIIRQARDSGESTFRVALQLIAPAALVATLILFVFGSEAIHALQRALDQSFLSGNALNLCWIITHFCHLLWPASFGGLLPDGSARIISLPSDAPLLTSMRVIFIAVYALIVVLYGRRARCFQDFVHYALLGFLAYFVLNVGVHENHLFLGMLLAVVLFLIDPTYYPYALFCSVAANVNLILFYGLTGRPGPRVVAGLDLALPLACVNVLFLLFVLAPHVRPLRR